MKVIHQNLQSTFYFHFLNLAAFCNKYNSKALNKEPTCFKNYMSPSCIDFYLKNCPKNFESTLFQKKKLAFHFFYEFIVTVLKVKHERVPPNIMQCRDYKNLDLKIFSKKLQVRLTNLDTNRLDFGSLKKCFTELLNKLVL